ncbi:uncharacterized protein H6S33_003072 [Morchella sextelata]|uniref:uncharacterized protein n=1 Tax=Morchella sextelata TaxID=1174677 RepID=UPI001D04B4FE|nr:uncharacterized protein H6S33_003072 [Morchella sextelata]KAH0607084.1 hypothetical protein H6S33_003072 [Morchella sextelata]
MSRMPALLLPDTAAPFAPRSPPTVVLNTTVDPWLTATLKRINRIKRPLNSVPQHMKCLIETLSQISAIWNLCSLMVARAPEAEIERHENPLLDAIYRYQLIHIKAYVVHIDLVLSNEIAFKLSQDTIKDLIQYHQDVFLVDQAATTWHWTDKDTQMKRLHEEFVQTVNKFVYRTDAVALEGMEDDGAGELLCGRSDDVRNLVMGFFLPLLPPPPRIVDVVRAPPPLLPSSPGTTNWWSPTPPAPPPSLPPPPPVEAWKILPSSPDTDSPPTSNSTMYPSIWGNMGMSDMSSMSSPTTHQQQQQQQQHQHQQHQNQQQQQYSQPPSHQLPLTPLPLPLPSLLAQQCSTGSGFGGFGWDRYQEYATTM